ncbi:winged helix-turn-helix domain-containing protein [Dactylosporangium sp. NBC_01737]|uniref:AfsR/SARP family transcriptional regulator n=1 Tax=Dactylosporangium sp. NBC_01737 TaxID=2975959 RepID=UPI002E0DC62E|nr:winged helix-turn-helix domain-containing protein [Dactylosporangium sp. NBC_01737]
MLVRLALDAGRVVRADRLIDELWPGDTARNTLQAKVSKLRRALGDPALITGSGAGSALAVDPGAVDALEVLRLAGTVPALRQDPGTAARVCAAALAMFRGDLLPGAGDGDWVAPHRARLAEAWLSPARPCAALRRPHRRAGGGRVVAGLVRHRRRRQAAPGRPGAGGARRRP